MTQPEEETLDRGVVAKEELEQRSIITSFKRGATVDEVLRWYRGWPREKLEALRESVQDDMFPPEVRSPAEKDLERRLHKQLVAAEVPESIVAFLSDEDPRNTPGILIAATLAGPTPMPDIVLDETQKLAVELICKAPIAIVTGGAGTGKTTTVRAALMQLELGEKKPLVALCAPTGKAARRIREATGYYAQTVHRLLSWEPQEHMWHHHAGNALPYDLVIVDEASMLDTELAAALLNAIAVQRTRIIFMGDVNQLPSVGPGYVLGDLLRSGHVPCVRLAQVHRQAQKSWVYRNAPRVLEGEPVELDGVYDDSVFYECSDTDQLVNTLLQVYESELNRLIDQNASAMGNGIEEALDRVQIVIPQKTGELGCELINARVQEAIHGELGKQDGVLVGSTVFTEGDKVIQTRNNYSLGVMNGETGVVTGFGSDWLEVTVTEEVKRYNRSDALDLQLGYAVTIHKMQGSQADTIIMMCTSKHSRMLTRQLFYTGITRAAKRLVLIGDRQAIDRSLQVGTIAQRQTKLVDRLNFVLEDLAEG